MNYKFIFKILPALITTAIIIIAQYSLKLENDINILFSALITITWILQLLFVIHKNNISVQDEDATEPQSLQADIVDCFEHIKLTSHKDIPPLIETLHQVQSVVQDANMKLQQSFSGLTENTTKQTDLNLEIVNNLQHENEDGTTSLKFDAFTAEASNVLRNYVDLAVNVSSKSVGTAYKMQDMMDQMDDMFKLLNDVSYLADQTGLLALNASIEAARAGDYGRGFAVVANEVRELSKKSTTLNEQIHKHVTLSKATLAETNEIVSEMASLDMDDALQCRIVLDKMIEDLDEVNRFVATSINASSDITQAIQSDVVNAVTALQYEDMVTQLIDYIIIKLQTVEKGVDSIDSMINQTELAEVLAYISSTLKNYESEGVRRVVASTSMESGEAELF